ncbi:MAG: THUMP domain-containing protein [Pseudomonadota bacterium]|nr:THUMP domain-containing protein [Pseudomonadota bacterium]
MSPNCIVIYPAEFTLKGHNRRLFEARLRADLERRLGAAGIFVPVRGGHDRLHCNPPPAQLEAALERARHTPGIARLATAIQLPPTAGHPDGLAPLEAALLALARERPAAGRRYAVRVRRSDKRIAATSIELERRFGAAIAAGSDWQHVDLRQPDITFHVDVHPRASYVYCEPLPGAGGLPVGSADPLIALLSGGHDSPVAACLLARRGSPVELVHFAAAHVERARVAENLVARIGARLSRHLGRTRLHILPSTYFDLALSGPPSGVEVLLLRRFMARAAAHLALRHGAGGIVTGDSLSQVASQTLANMASMDAAVELPILRPLIGLDKQQIIALAREIGTFELSAQPYKDCCALLGREPRTRSVPARLAELEALRLADYPALLQRTLNDALVIELEDGRLSVAPP